jgi:CheY-like chemotaxis protein
MSPSPDTREADGNGRLRVLVVDDEPTLRLGFSYALTNRTTIVETAANGRAALERVADTPFDILLLDLRMPEIDGLGVIETLRASGSSIPVVLCSAALQPRAVLGAIRHGVVDFLLKPVRPADLREVIQSVMHPGRDPLALALKAARGGAHHEAIRILAAIPHPDTRATCWLEILKDLADAAPDSSELEEKIRLALSTIVFNSTNP